MTATKSALGLMGQGSAPSEPVAPLQIDPGVTASIRTLLVEDDPGIGQALRSVLESADGIEIVAEAHGSREAVNRVAEQRVDVVLLDLDTPGLDDLETTRHIRAKRPRTAVVMLTGHGDDGGVVTALEAGASAYLPKDVPLDMLVYAIRAASRGETLIKTSVLQEAIAGLVGANGRQRLSRTRNGFGCKQLTRRELNVLELVADGLTNKEVGRVLFIAEDTAKKHVQSIMGKLDACDRTHAVMKAARIGLIR